jgi:hypothetical protein
LYDILSVEHYNEILNYCLIRHRDCDRFFVPEEKKTLFQQLIHWFVYCVDAYDSDVNIFAAREPLGVTKSLYLKEQQRKIDNFVVLPQKMINNDVKYWRRICHHCLSHRTVSDMGFISDARWKYLFYAIQEKSLLTVLMKYRAHNDDDDMSLEVDDVVTVRLSLFCKSLTPPTSTQQIDLSHLHHPTRIAQILLNSPETCYEGTCDTCQKKKHIYIIDVSVIFEKPHSNDDGWAVDQNEETNGHNHQKKYHLSPIALTITLFALHTVTLKLTARQINHGSLIIIRTIVFIRDVFFEGLHQIDSDE